MQDGQNNNANDQQPISFRHEGRPADSTLSEAIANDVIEVAGEPAKKIYPTAPDADGYFYASAEDEAEGDMSRIYPTKPDEEGFFYEDEGKEVLKIETKEYPNGNKIFRATLRSGKVAVIRELKGKDAIKAQKIAGKDQAKLQAAYAALATKIDDVEYVMEDLLELKSSDFNKILTASNLLNFL